MHTEAVQHGKWFDVPSILQLVQGQIAMCYLKCVICK